MKIFDKIVFVILVVFTLESCNSKQQDNSCPIELLDEEPKNICELVLKAYNSIGKDTFFELSQLLNDSINNRTDYFYLRSATHIITNKIIDGTTQKITNDISLGFLEQDLLPKGLPNELLFYICIKDENTILTQHKPANINDLKDEVKTFIFELGNLNKNIAVRKTQTDLFGEVEVPKFMIIMSLNAKGNKLPSREWQLFFKCLYEIFTVFKENRDNLSIKMTGKNFNSLTFEQKEAIYDISSCNIVLFFDEECL